MKEFGSEKIIFDKKTAVRTYNGKNVVTTLLPSFLDGASSFLQITRLTIKAWMGLNFGKIPSLTSELAALERQKN